VIVILCDAQSADVSERLAGALQDRYGADQSTEVISSPANWTHEAQWDDLLVLLYAEPALPTWAAAFVEQFRAAHPTLDSASGRLDPGGMVLPVGLPGSVKQPPPPLSSIKGVQFDGTDASLKRVLNTIGRFLGLAIRPSEHQVFISYATTDGREIATDLNARLETEGFRPWLDEGPGGLPAGVNMLQHIRETLGGASMVVLIDTPAAPGSTWISTEVECALSELIPVLPVVVGEATQTPRIGPPRDLSRFIQLKPLQRRAPVKPAGPDGCALSHEEWTQVRSEIEAVLAAAYRRRSQIRFHAEAAFSRNGFDWRVVDIRRRMFEARRKMNPMLPEKVVLSHCSIHDPDYTPALRVYGQYLKGLPHIASVNEKVCLFADAVLGPVEVERIWSELNGVPQFTLANYTELGLWIRSNFTQLAP